MGGNNYSLIDVLRGVEREFVSDTTHRPQRNDTGQNNGPCHRPTSQGSSLNLAVVLSTVSQNTILCCLGETSDRAFCMA